MSEAPWRARPLRGASPSASRSLVSGPPRAPVAPPAPGVRDVLGGQGGERPCFGSCFRRFLGGSRPPVVPVPPGRLVTRGERRGDGRPVGRGVEVGARRGAARCPVRRATPRRGPPNRAVNEEPQGMVVHRPHVPPRRWTPPGHAPLPSTGAGSSCVEHHGRRQGRAQRHEGVGPATADGRRGPSTTRRFRASWATSDPGLGTDLGCQAFLAAGRAGRAPSIIMVTMSTVRSNAASTRPSGSAPPWASPARRTAWSERPNFFRPTHVVSATCNRTALATRSSCGPLVAAGIGRRNRSAN